MPDSNNDYLTGVFIGDPQIGADIFTKLHLGAEGRTVRFAFTLPYFNKDQVLKTIKGNAPQVILLSANIPGYNAQEAVSLRLDTETPFILAGLAQAGSTEGQDMMMMGFDVVFNLPLSDSTIDQICRDVPSLFPQVANNWKRGAFAAVVPKDIQTTLAASGGASWQRQKILCYSPKGGTGKTTLAKELSVILSSLGGKKVALIDVNMNGGHIQNALKVQTQFGILNAATMYYDTLGTPLETETATKILNYMKEIPGTNGMGKVLPGIDNMNKASNENLAGEKGMKFVEWFTGYLKGFFDFVIVDMGSSLTTGVHIGALKSADKILVIVTPDLNSMGDAYASIHTFIAPKLGIDINRFALVYNQFNSEVGIPITEASKQIGITALAQIPHDPTYSVTFCSNKGISYFSQFSPRTDNPQEISATLNGMVELASNFFPPIIVAWDAMKGNGKNGSKSKGGLFSLGRKNK
jgi:MinD-like ATPase involved in chromosome partitioning or flagellar assembly